ncbi:MAG: hypothetical protein OES10_08225 [Gammaproteobacteria bacterium]|nr:hypothetical protein [Gammaproteobacteria bacterium]
MTCLSRLPLLLLPLVIGACSVNAPSPAPAEFVTQVATTNVSHGSAHEAMLLVSLDDGTVIKQTISVDADVCFKQNSSSSTTCLTQGKAIIDAATNTVIGFEMIEDHIDLVAKTD